MIKFSKEEFSAITDCMNESGADKERYMKEILKSDNIKGVDNDGTVTVYDNDKSICGIYEIINNGKIMNENVLKRIEVKIHQSEEVKNIIEKTEKKEIKRKRDIIESEMKEELERKRLRTRMIQASGYNISVDGKNYGIILNNPLVSEVTKSLRNILKFDIDKFMWQINSEVITIDDNIPYVNEGTHKICVLYETWHYVEIKYIF